jgi:3-oxoacyl-[acyl-carrier-protein] synthase-3
MRIDGAKGMELTLFTNVRNCPLATARDEASPYVSMNGREVFKFAVGVVPASIQRVLAQASLTVDQLDYLVLHQANIRIMQAMSEKLNIPEERLIVNLDKFGNTSAASIPIALNEAVLAGRVKPGHVLAMCGFGAGLAWASTVLRWTAVDQRLAQASATAASVPS